MSTSFVPSTTLSVTEAVERAAFIRSIWEDWYAPNQPDADGNWVRPTPMSSPGGLPEGWRYVALVRPPDYPDRHPDHGAFHLLRFDDQQCWVLGETWASKNGSSLLVPRVSNSLGGLRDQLGNGVKPRTRRYAKLQGFIDLFAPLLPAETVFLLALGNLITDLPDECYSPTFGLSLIGTQEQ